MVARKFYGASGAFENHVSCSFKKDARGMELCNNSAYCCPEIDCKHNKIKGKNEPLMKPGWKHFIVKLSVI